MPEPDMAAIRAGLDEAKRKQAEASAADLKRALEHQPEQPTEGDVDPT